MEFAYLRSLLGLLLVQPVQTLEMSGPVYVTPMLSMQVWG